MTEKLRQIPQNSAPSPKMRQTPLQRGRRLGYGNGVPTTTITYGGPRLLGLPCVVQMFKKILPVLHRENLVHITKTSRQMHVSKRGHPQARQTSQRGRRTDSMFRKNHVSWTLVQFINNFLILLTGFISRSRPLKFVNVHIIIGQIIGLLDLLLHPRVPYV